ncbi:MAG: hypothetical protein IPO36_11915 [Anaerolineales bacterium]|jgi:hypothetical protein|uniref:DUF6391 domain-containing protein n=1 Tax=Candidatus Villigracilis affinis TaxID=3140682 RepID=UPI001B650906|nr:hypothetical protein [Anaerolineales bacterium]MBK9602529.1 hypothetical protein [Anaerolineales bacterium]MBL0347127.1 hypothetical protein [Anaerolineales bacterium]MBP8047610.1 hypothetical protein [Anaerolineales bacterium]
MILDLPFILETRRNHALEHATLHMLAHTHTGTMAGHSNPTGFFLLGNFSTQDVWAAATEALERLRGGESGLAIHAGCGTNMATTALLAGTFAWSVLRLAKSTLMKILLMPLAVFFGVVGFLISRPLGPVLQQRITTEANMGNMQIIDIIPVRKGVHRVITR